METRITPMCVFFVRNRSDRIVMLHPLRNHFSWMNLLGCNVEARRLLEAWQQTSSFSFTHTIPWKTVALVAVWHFSGRGKVLWAHEITMRWHFLGMSRNARHGSDARQNTYKHLYECKKKWLGPVGKTVCLFLLVRSKVCRRLFCRSILTPRSWCNTDQFKVKKFEIHQQSGRAVKGARLTNSALMRCVQSVTSPLTKT